MSLVESFLRRPQLNPVRAGNHSETLESLMVFLELG
jgi:hypothetical protein